MKRTSIPITRIGRSSLNEAGGADGKRPTVAMSERSPQVFSSRVSGKRAKLGDRSGSAGSDKTGSWKETCRSPKIEVTRDRSRVPVQAVGKPEAPARTIQSEYGSASSRDAQIGYWPI